MSRQRPPRKPRATYEDVLSAPPDRNAEILAGQLVVSPRPAPPHATASSALTGMLFDFNGDEGRGGRGDGPGGWRILHEPELHFAEDVLVPDIAGWRRERLPALPEQAHFTLAPDWVCEVASPSTNRHDRVTKSTIYCREGVTRMWLVDPLAQTLEVFRRYELPDGADAPTESLAGAHWLLVEVYGDDGEGDPPVVRPEPFAALPFDLSLLWR